MIALVTGASSGIGRDIAIYLNRLGHDLVITGREEANLKQLQKQLQENGKQRVEVVIADLTDTKQCIELYQRAVELYGKIDILINNAGFGLFGAFVETDLETELAMIDTNIKAVHTLTKLAMKDMTERDQGYILNVSSVAGFLPGPLMSTYYGTKNYVFRFTEAIREELKKKKSKVQISVLCPGPVATNFNEVAKVKFNLRQRKSEEVAKYAVDHMLKKQFVIMPGIEIKVARFFSKVVPDSILAEFCYHMQEKKKGV